MKKIWLIIPFYIIVSLSFKNNIPIIKKFNVHKRYPFGVSDSYSGAPGEPNCTYCHNGNTQSGASINAMYISQNGIPVSSYIADSSYSVLLTMTPSPSSRGFQAVALTNSNSSAGVFTTINNNTGSSVHILNGRATHTDCSDTLAWRWNWKAPATNIGPVTFYVSTLKSDESGTTSGDIVYLSQFEISPSNAKCNEKNKYSFTARYSSNENTISLNFNSLIVGEMYLNLVDISGISVYTNRMGNSIIGSNYEKIILPNEIKNGIYFVNMFVNNNAMQHKIMINN